MASRRKRICLIVAVIIVAIAVVVGLFARSYVLKPYGGDDSVRLYVPSGTDGESLLDSLCERLGDEFAETVYRLWKLQGGDMSVAHGSYVVSPGMTVLSVSRNIRYGRQTPVKVTFNNLRTVDDLAGRLSAKMEWGSDEFIAACDSVLPGKGFKKEQYAAAFLPDTYEFYWTTPAVKVVKRLSDLRDAYWTKERRERAAGMGLTPVGVATLASIVEEETAKADERGKVARLYLNRISRGMLLQADPTVKFALGDFGLRRLRHGHLSVDSPYNTYLYKGLPPGPIRIVERRTLDAVLDAPVHDYLYMCAKSDFSGYHDFASDFASHKENARRYQRELDRRGIR